MARIAVVTSHPPLARGGHLVIAEALATALREAGHDAGVLLTPQNRFGRQAGAYLATWLTDVGLSHDGKPVDQVISLRFPSYAVRHPAHVCWLNHRMREYYDQWPVFSGQLSLRARVKERVRRSLMHAADRYLLTHNVTRLYAQSRTIQSRLERWGGIPSVVVYPPPPARAYRCDGYGDQILVVSRLTPLKRVELVIDALAEPEAAGVSCVIVGDGEAAPRLRQRAAEHGLAGRVTFLGAVGEAALVDQLARCRAVCFPTHQEDYGLVTVEAFASSKAVITCADSGGPAELVAGRREWVGDGSGRGFVGQGPRRSRGGARPGRASRCGGASAGGVDDVGASRQATPSRVEFARCSSALLAHGTKNIMAYSSNLEARLARKVTKAITTFDLVEDGDRVMVGLSGGKDSWALMQLLDVLRRRAPIRFSLVAVNVHSGYADYKHKEIAHACEARGWEYRIERTTIGEVLEDVLDADATPCSLCARLRRGVLYRLASEVGATKIALGHHADDFMETLLLNLFFAGSLKAMPARLVSDNGQHVVIRPLVYVAEDEARAYTRDCGLPVIGCCCPACGDLSLKRQRMKRLLLDLDREHPGVKNSMLKAIGNVAPRHLLDTRLNPVGELRARVATGLERTAS